MNARITKTENTNYKDGFVQCACGWYKSLGDGFNQYFIDKCPLCSNEITTRVQNVVTVGRPGNYKIMHGHFIYFVLDNGINIQYQGITCSVSYASRIPN